MCVVSNPMRSSPPVSLMIQDVSTRLCTLVYWRMFEYAELALPSDLTTTDSYRGECAQFLVLVFICCILVTCDSVIRGASNWYSKGHWFKSKPGPFFVANMPYTTVTCKHM